MTAPLVQKLSLVVDATTGGAEGRMDALATSAREAGEAATRSAGQVAAAADRVAQAQLKRDEAVDRVALAERRLQEAQDRGEEGSSRVLAAEQKLESARRQLHVATNQLEAAEEGSAAAQRDAAESTQRLATEQEKAGSATDRFGGQLDDLSGTLKGLAGFSLGAFVTQSVTGFAEGARNAGLLSRALNSTTEEAGQFVAIAERSGLEARDLLGIVDTFQQAVKANAGVLDDLGVSLAKNSDGTVNYAQTLRDTLVQLQRIPDSTRRTALAYQLLSDEGAEYLSTIYNGTRDVSDIFDSLGVPFDDEAVQSAAEFDQALQDLRSTGSSVGTTLGGGLLPVVTGVLEGFGAVVNVVESVPGPLAVATAGVVLFGLAQRSAATEGSLLANAIQGGRDRVAGFQSAVGEASNGAGRLATGLGVARVAGGGLLSALGGPLGVTVLGLGAGFSILNNLVGSNSERSKAAAQANSDLAAALQETNGVVTQSVREQAAKSAQDAGIIDVARKVGVAQGDVTDALLGNEDAYQRVKSALDDYYDASLTSENAGNADITETAEAARQASGELTTLRDTVVGNADAQQELAGELGQTADKQALATAATDALTSALDAGNVSTEELTRLAHDAAVAQDTAAEANNRAEAAMDAYRATTTGAYQATLDLINANLGAENAQFQFLNAVDAAKTATDDATTSVDEQRQAQVNLIGAAIAAAGAVGDAAVQNARAAGQVVDDLAEAQIRADAVLGDLRAKLDTPGLTESARNEVQGLIDQLQTARDKGDIQTVLSLTGADQVTGELDDTTEDRDTTVTIESRNGPAVIRYIEQDVAKDRLALIRVESRNGPAVDSYVDSLTRERLTIIRVETRNGPAVDDYLDQLARTRTAIINVQQRTVGAAGGGGGPGAGFGAGLFGAGGVTIQQLAVYPQVDGGGRLGVAELQMTGRQIIGAIRGYEQQNGTGWRRDGRS